jgi:Tfp pilus assembly protein PilF
MHAISGGEASAAALTEVYGKTVPQIEKDLQGYLRGTTFRGALVQARIEKISGDIPAEPLGEFDTDLMLSDLSYRRGKEADHKAALERLAALDPKRPEPYRGLAYLAWSSGQADAAREQFAKAFTCGDRDPKLLWDYGRLILQSGKSEEAIPVLSALVTQQPERLDVRLEIADAQLRAGKAADALTTIAAVHKVTAEESAHYFRTAVYAHLMNGDRANAQATARHFMDVAKTDADRAAAQRLLNAVAARDPVTSAKTATSNAVPPADTDTRPILQRTVLPPAAPPAAPRPQQLSLTGLFVELQCRGNQARMILENAAGRKTFVIDDPGNVKITGKGDWHVDMTCGPQKARARVEVGYDPPGAQPGVDGVVRSIDYK